MSKRIMNICLVILGSGIVAVGLQFFLLPNHLVDGGVTGLSIIASRIFGLPLGLFLIALNTPFVILGYRKFGKSFAALSILGIVTLSSLTLVHVEQSLTHEPILAAIFGGIIVGIGVGLVVRYGGVIDGTDTLALLIDRVTVFSVGEAIMAINGIIIATAGFVFGWENALYSLVAYFVAHKAIDTMIEGLDESRSFWIVSMHVRDIGAALNLVVNEPVTYLKEANSKDPEPHGIILAVVTRFEEQKAKDAIYAVDKTAYVVISEAHEVVSRVSTHSLKRGKVDEVSSLH